MAVAMEMGWRPSGGDQLQLEGGRSGTSKKRAWGADTEKLMELMMGQFSRRGSGGGDGEASEVTLDLLGTGDRGGGSVEGLDCKPTSVVDEFLEVDPDLPLPSGWEQCLDLKTGELYFVSKSTGMRTSEDPRKLQSGAESLMGAVIAPRTPARPAHEFLASKKEETLRASTSSGSSGGEDVTTTPRSRTGNAPSAMTQLLSFSTGKRLWNLQLDDRDRTTISVNKTATSWGTSPRAPPFPNSPPGDESNLELNLNLSPSRPSPTTHTQTVCTMEMVQQALKRTEKAIGKREAVIPLSTSSSFSSLAEPSWSRSSPSTSSSSTSKSGAHDATITTTPRVNSEAVESSGAPLVELVMGPCTRCLMFVMVNEKDPKCPRCESEVRFESFTSVVPSVKRRRVEAPLL